MGAFRAWAVDLDLPAFRLPPEKREDRDDLVALRKLRLLFEDFPKNHNLVLIGRPSLLANLDHAGGFMDLYRRKMQGWPAGPELPESSDGCR